MATERTAMLPDGTVVFLNTNKDAMTPFGAVISEQHIVAASGIQPTNYYYTLMTGNR